MKKVSLMIAGAVLLLFLSGSSGNERLTDMTVIQAVGIDFNENTVTVTVQYLDIDKGTGTNEGVKGNITAVTQGSGKTIDSAIASVEKTLPDRLFFSQNKIIVLCPKAEEKLKGELLQILSDNRKCRPDTLIVKSKTTAEAVIRNTQRKSRVPAENICKQLKREKSLFTVNDYLNELKENRLPVIEARGDYTLVLKR